MSTTNEDRFVRVPTKWLEPLLQARLSGSQWRILLWVARYTFGWNREWTPFSWYRIAKETGLDRGVVYRAAKGLLRANLLVSHETQLALQTDRGAWDESLLEEKTHEARQLWMPGISVVKEQRQAMSGDNAAVAKEQRNRCQASSLFRRAKDRCKDRLKTYKDTRARENTLDRASQRNTERLPLAEAAQPIPGKYDRLSQD